MQVDVKSFLDNADVKDSLYPGKRIVKPCKQIGEYKNHCVVIDWRDPEAIQIDIKPGLSGKQLAPEIVHQYPVCFQMPTSVRIKVINDNISDEEDDEDEKSKGKSGGGGGKKPAKKKLEDVEVIGSCFDKHAEGKIPNVGEIKSMVVLGVQLAKEAFGTAFQELTKQIQHAKITATEVLSKAADMVTRVEPASYIKPTGDETQRYQYDRDKNADIGFKSNFG